LVEPDDIGELADAVHQSLDDEDRRERAARCGVARAAKLTWAACASKTVDVYREVVRRGSGRWLPYRVVIGPEAQPEHFALDPWGLDPGTPCRDHV